MKKLTLLSCIAAGLISTTTIAETISGKVGGSTRKGVGGVTGGAVGSGVSTRPQAPLLNAHQKNAHQNVVGTAGTRMALNLNSLLEGIDCQL